MQQGSYRLLYPLRACYSIQTRYPRPQYRYLPSRAQSKRYLNVHRPSSLIDSAKNTSTPGSMIHPFRTAPRNRQVPLSYISFAGPDSPIGGSRRNTLTTVIAKYVAADIWQGRCSCPPRLCRGWFQLASSAVLGSGQLGGKANEQDDLSLTVPSTYA